MKKFLENKIVKLVIFLAIVSGVSGGVLALVNGITAPIIEEHALAAEKANLEIIFPGADFSPVEFEDESGIVQSIFSTSDGGYAYKMSVGGYGGDIVFMIGVDANNSIVGYTILSSLETSGIGDAIEKDNFVNSIVGKPSNGTFDTITGATVSSTAIIKGLDAALSIHNTNAGVSGTVETPDDNNEEEIEKTSVSEIELVSSTDGINTYSVKAEGMYEGNTFEVLVDTNTKTIVSITYTKVEDTPEFVEAVNNEEYLSKFVGVDIETVGSIDVVSGSTLSSNTVIDSAKAALKDLEVEVPSSVSNIELTSEDDSSKTYNVTVEGMYEGNVIEVVVNTTDNTVASVSYVTAEDTPEFVEAVNNEEYLANFVGKNINTLNEVDVASGSTLSSNSVKDAVTAAIIGINDTSNDETGLVSEDDTTRTYEITTYGFVGDNTYTIVVNKEDNSIASVEFKTIGDTPEYVAEVNTVEYLESYIGLTSADIESVDVVAGSSNTVRSLKEALTAALVASEGAQ